jgi:hypothetical protein
VTQIKASRTRAIPQWQSNKMKQIIVDRWQEIWSVVEARNKNTRTLSSQGFPALKRQGLPLTAFRGR